MINLTRLFRPSCTLALFTGVLVSMIGCSDPPPPPPKKPTTAPTVQGPPPAKPIDDLIAENGIDDRVWMDERQAPPTNAQRLGLLEFFDGFATGNPDQLRPFLGPVEQEELAKLEASGDLEQLAADIEGIEIRMGVTNEGRSAVLGLYEFADRIEGQMWEIESGPGQDGMGSVHYIFVAAYAPPGLSDWLGSDPFSDWYTAVTAEQAMLNKADLGMEAARAKASDSSDDPAAAPSGDSGGGGPGGPGLR
jgi:hypothetical protein